MKSFTKLLRILLIVFLLLALLIVYGVAKIQEVKHDLGLTVDWQNLQVGIQGITFEKLTIDQQSSDGTLTTTISQNVMLSFSTLTIKHLDVKVQLGDYIIKEKEKASQIDLKRFLDNLNWAPHQIKIEKFDLSIPCSSSFCNLSGSAELLQTSNANKPITLLATVNENLQLLDIKAELYQKSELFTLILDANFNKEPLLSLSTQIDETLKHWQGSFNLYKIQNTSQLFSFMQYFLPNQEVFTNIPYEAKVDANWQLYFPDGLMTLRPKKGEISIDASLPNRWPIIHLGHLQGLLQTKVLIDNSLPKVENINVDLTLTNLSSKLLTNIPQDLQPIVVNLILQPLTAANDAIELSLTTEGKLNTLLYSKIFINPKDTTILLTDSNFQANTNKLTWVSYSLQNAQLLLPFNATITPQKANVTFSPDVSFKAQQLIIDRDTVAKNLQLTAKSLKATIDYQDNNSMQWSLGTPITLTTKTLAQPLLKTQSWSLTGRLDASSKQTLLAAKISNTADFAANITLITDYKKQLTIKGKTPDLFFRNSNIFAKTFKDWPELLDIGTGKASISNMLLSIPFDNKALSLESKINAIGLSGIFDRIEFRDLSGTALININNNKLKIALPDLALTEANPGFDMGPLQFNGEYNASIKKPLEGVLNWTKAELTLFTGEVWLKPGVLDLAKLPQEINVQIKNIQLKDILKAYPTEGLNGEGDIDGYLPIIITKTGLDIKEGKLAARKAGYIKFNSPAIKAVGENNPNMKLVTDALENFQYSVLSSQISYDQGNAFLGLQIKGKNPDVKDGQAVNLNISLQENIPALMTTLQLSDRVSDIIQKRVQKRLQQGASKK